MTRIKICGITSVNDAQLAIAAGADYIGLIFAESSPRTVDVEVASQIARAITGKAQIVGVFKDQPVEMVASIAREVRLQMVQLHGDESPSYCSSTMIPVVKAFSIKPDQPWPDIDAYGQACAAVLIDRPKGYSDPGWLDWALSEVPKHKISQSLFFAGGLTPENVRSVIQSLKPFAVDVASGVESSPGTKDEQKMREFCSVVKQETEDAIVG